MLSSGVSPPVPSGLDSLTVVVGFSPSTFTISSFGAESSSLLEQAAGAVSSISASLFKEKIYFLKKD